MIALTLRAGTVTVSSSVFQEQLKTAGQTIADFVLYGLICQYVLLCNHTQEGVVKNNMAFFFSML